MIFYLTNNEQPVELPTKTTSPPPLQTWSSERKPAPVFVSDISRRENCADGRTGPVRVPSFSDVKSSQGWGL